MIKYKIDHIVYIELPLKLLKSWKLEKVYFNKYFDPNDGVKFQEQQQP